jgi:hypothetical protein
VSLHAIEEPLPVLVLDIILVAGGLSIPEVFLSLLLLTALLHIGLGLEVSEVSIRLIVFVLLIVDPTPLVICLLRQDPSPGLVVLLPKDIFFPTFQVHPLL